MKFLNTTLMLNLFLLLFSGCSSLKERISNNFIKVKIENCRKVISETKPDFTQVWCNEMETSCAQRLIRMAPGVDCTYSIIPCKNEAQKNLLAEWNSRVPESCHELKKKYPRAFYQPEPGTEMP